MDIVETAGQLILKRMRKLAFPKIPLEKLSELEGLISINCKALIE